LDCAVASPPCVEAHNPGDHQMRVLLTSWGSRGDIQPLAALALRLRELGAEVRACLPPDEEFVTLFARVGVTPSRSAPRRGRSRPA